MTSYEKHCLVKQPEVANVRLLRRFVAARWHGGGYCGGTYVAAVGLTVGACHAWQGSSGGAGLLSCKAAAAVKLILEAS